jgi:hypothetical protein
MANGKVKLSNIDKICKRFSMEIASGNAGKPPIGTPLQSLSPQVHRILDQHGMTGSFGPLRSSYKHNGKTVEFISMTQSFEIASNDLLELAKDLAYPLRLDVHQETAGRANVGVSFSLDTHTPILLDQALFEYSGSEFTAVTLPDNKIVTLKGTCNGTAHPEERYISLNIISGNLEALIHEALHLKVAPDEFQKNDAPIGQIGSHVSSLIQGLNPDKWEEWDKKLEFSRMKALESFRALNEDLGKVIPNEW